MSVSVNTNKARVVNDHHETNLLVIAHKHTYVVNMETLNTICVLQMEWRYIMIFTQEYVLCRYIGSSNKLKKRKSNIGTD